MSLVRGPRGRPFKLSDVPRSRGAAPTTSQPVGTYARLWTQSRHRSGGYIPESYWANDGFAEQEQHLATRWEEATAGKVPAPTSLAKRTTVGPILETRASFVTPEGRATLDALYELRIISPFVRQSLALLAREYPSPQALSGVSMVYNGHATQAMTGLFPMLETFGLGRGSMIFSPTSGSLALAPVYRHQVRAVEGQVYIPHVAPTDAHAGDLEQQRRDPLAFQPGDAPDLSPVEEWEPDARDSQATQHAKFSVFTIKKLAREAAAEGRVLVVDKGGMLANAADAELKGLIENGTLRFIVHNSDDVKALRALTDKAYMVDLAGGLLKAKESKRVIGEHLALLGAREVRLSGMGRSIREVRPFVVGFGPLGRGIIEAMIRLGYPAEQLTVVETDPHKRAQARALGVCVRSAEEGNDAPALRPDKALVFVATPDVGVSAHNIHQFGKQSLFVGVTSGGKGFDLASLHDAANAEEVVGHRFGGALTGNSTHRYRDLRYQLGQGEQQTEATVVIEGLPLNLNTESWAERYNVTSVAVALATLEAARLTGPGLHPMPAALEQELLDLYEAAGLDEVRPLEVPFVSPAYRSRETADELAADLAGFTQSPSLR